MDAIKPLARSTRRAGADASLGGFGALFDLKAAGFHDPLLVTTTDGVGTKLKIAIETGRHDTVGIDLVGHVRQRPAGPGRRAAAVPGLLRHRQAGRGGGQGRGRRHRRGLPPGRRCALVGGETAEMPGMYGEGDYDLAGFCVGAVERGPGAAGPGGPARRRPADRAGIVGAALQRLFADPAHRDAIRLGLGCARAVRAGRDPGRGADATDPHLCEERAACAADRGRG